MVYCGVGIGHTEATGRMPLLPIRTTITAGTWNVRTMWETGKIAHAAEEMKSYNHTLLGISETHWIESGQTITEWS